MLMRKVAGHALFFIIRYAQKPSYPYTRIGISAPYLSRLSVLKNSIHTQHEAFLGSI